MKIKFLLKWLLAILIFAVSFAVVYWYFTTYVQSNKTDTKHIVGRKNIEDVLTVYGSVMSDSDRALSFQTNGIVKKIIKKEGDDVSNGEIIAYLNNDDLNFDIKKAYVDLEIEKSKLEDIKGGSTRSEAVVAQKQFILVSASARKEINQSIIELDNILNDTKQVIFLELDKLFSNAKTRRPYFEYSISHSAKQKFEKGRRDIQYILDSWDKYVFNTADIDKITAEFFISSVDGVLYDIYVIHNYLQKIILDLSEELVSIDDADQELLNRVYKITSAARKKVVEKKDSVIFELSNVSKSASDYKNTIEEIKSKIQTQEPFISSNLLFSISKSTYAFFISKFKSSLFKYAIISPFETSSPSFLIIFLTIPFVWKESALSESDITDPYTVNTSSIFFLPTMCFVSVLFDCTYVVKYQ